MQYAIITTLVAVAAVAVNAWQFRRNRKKVAEISNELTEAIKANHSLQEQVRKQRHIIKAAQEVMHETAEKKREIRKHPDPTDRANAATDIMSKLAGSGDGNGDDSPAA